MKKRIVITGVGVISPIGSGKEAFTQALRQGSPGPTVSLRLMSSAYSTQIAAHVKDFKAEDFLDKKKIRRMAQFSQYGLAAAKMAVTDSGLDPAKEDMSRIGVITGTGIGGLDVIEQEEKNLVEKGPRRVSPFLIPMIITNILPGEIAIEYGFTGPNYAVTSACASANNAIGDSMRMLDARRRRCYSNRRGEAAITPLGLAGFCSIKALSVEERRSRKGFKAF